MEAVVLGTIALIYFYALRWDDIPKDRQWIVHLVPILLIALLIWQGYQV